jgi:hypothetical protein
MQRWSLVPIRDQSLAPQPGDLSRPYFLGMGPSRWSKLITDLLCDPAYPPFCEGLHCPWLRAFTLDPIGHVLHVWRLTLPLVADIVVGPYWTCAPQSIIDHRIIESLRGFHPHVAPPGLTVATIWLVLLDPISWNLYGDFVETQHTTACVVCKLLT